MKVDDICLLFSYHNFHLVARLIQDKKKIKNCFTKKKCYENTPLENERFLDKNLNDK